MPTRCNRGFYFRSYCLLNMFRASLYPSSGAQEYYTVVAAFGISCCKNVKKNNFVSFCGICVLSLKCRVLSRFVTRCVECRGGCVWVFLVGFLVYSLVCGSGIPFVGCDCMTVDVVDSCMHTLQKNLPITPTHSPHDIRHTL